MSEQYIVSARKYRPDTFASIVGQQAMASTLKTAVLSGRMAHAYLFCGPRGVGKTTAARVLAKTINCLNLQPSGEACNECESCKAFNEGRSFNIFELDAASNNSVEDIRTLIEQVSIAPVLGRYKVYIIDEVHMLSQAAFNAFLKTLEEPPSYAIFILATTEKHKILPTILSRCQIYDFKRITVSDIAHHLKFVADSEGITAEETALGLIAEKADGGMRDALSMFDRVASYGEGSISYQQALECLNILDYTYYVRFIRAFIQGDYRETLLILDEVLSKGFDGQLIMAGLAAFARDLLVVQHADTIKLLEKPETVQTIYEEAARLVAPNALHQIIRFLLDADSKYRTSTNKRLLIELTLLNILTAFTPTALGSMPEIAPERTAAPAASPRPTAMPQATPTPSPTTQRQEPTPAPKQEAVAPKTEQASAPAPSQESTEPKQEAAPIQVKPIATPRPSQQEQIRQTRRQFRMRHKTAEDDTQEEAAPLEEAHEAFTLEDAQIAYSRYLEDEIPKEEIVLKQTLGDVLPQLGDNQVLSIALANSPAIIEPVKKKLPHLQRYLQSALKNTDLRVEIQPIDIERIYIPTTNREKYEALAESYPILHKLKEQLQLRIL
ncbi:MAG: DNA polymerase III subunit gamma/tau [Porphyromonas sp.]|nr:MAG: DNA polymerase III subunit gamma/tau [Porphyromonas sp.]